ncbi:hypothetical protein [Actinomadura madurae]|uniref:hypothetical protein n=1 Tax=Actinomadura madurae TaxID=1993 RepID=UPI0020D25EB5|nr:hypothetical protein [Actinomadura madurae]MCP9966613.1 hypothetical protein [Actinomadura madurae]MCP9979105.1 hypothetical protein [Actinomadura madurae]
MGPRERYLVGMLGPRHSPASALESADEMPDTEVGVGGDASEGGLPEVVSPQTLGKIWASSMGLSFCVPADVDAVVVKAGWGRYELREQEDEDGKKLRIWSREPVEREEEIRLDGEESFKIMLTGEHEDASGVLLSVNVRRRDARRVVEIALVNQQSEPTGNKDTAWLFQPELTVTALDGAKAVFLPVDDPVDDLQAVGDDAEELHLRLLYRNERRYAAGRNVAVHADVAEGGRVAHRLTTTWLPVHNVPATIAPTGSGTPLEHVELSMDVLAEATPAELHHSLQPLVEGYKAWLGEREDQIPGLPAPLREAAAKAVHDARRAANRIEAGVTLLSDETAPRHGEALAAFHFANKAMALQRRHTAIAPLREEGLTYAEALQEIDGRGKAAASWRPFQLAFVLLNLPSLTDPGHDERVADHAALVDLLFFPTGGGKTEAYLGLTAYTFAIRRLQRTLGTAEDARDGMAGVAVLMRYTLRLLTAQQFQRAAALVCAAETIRRDDPVTWGRSGSASGCGSAPECRPTGSRTPRTRSSRPATRGTATAPTSCRRWPARGAARNCGPNATCTSTTTAAASCCTARAARGTRARSPAGSPATRASLSSPWTRRSTGTRRAWSSPPSTSSPSFPGRATPASCSDVPAATATGTASATTTWTRRPGARASTTRRAHSPR